MKHKTILSLSLFMLASMSSMDACAQSAVAIVDEEGMPCALFVKETRTQLLGQCCEHTWFNKKDGFKTKWLYAEKGEGLLAPTCQGVLNIREKPTTDSKVVAKWIIPDGEVPDFYDCMGKEGNWYKVRTYDYVDGYVRSDLVEWWPCDISCR